MSNLLGMPERERYSRYKQHEALYQKSKEHAERLNQLSKSSSTFIGKLSYSLQSTKQSAKAGKIASTMTKLNKNQFGPYRP